MQKHFLAIITACLVLTGCMSSGPPPSLASGNCINLCSELWYESASTADLKAELKSGANVNARNRYGKTPLHIAAAWGKPAHIKILIDAGALVNARDKDGETPLHKASSDGDPRFTAGLINKLENLRFKNIKILINAGVDVNARDNNEYTPLHYAVKVTSKHVKRLLNAGADVNAREINGRTPLHEAVLYGTADTVKMLLNAGADPNAQNYGFNNPFVYGSSSEKITTRAEWPEIANLLKAAGSETKKSTVDKTKRAACIASGVIFSFACAKY